MCSQIVDLSRVWSTNSEHIWLQVQHADCMRADHEPPIGWSAC